MQIYQETCNEIKDSAINENDDAANTKRELDRDGTGWGIVQEGPPGGSSLVGRRLRRFVAGFPRRRAFQSRVRILGRLSIGHSHAVGPGGGRAGALSADHVLARGGAAGSLELLRWRRLVVRRLRCDHEQVLGTIARGRWRYWQAANGDLDRRRDLQCRRPSWRRKRSVAGVAGRLCRLVPSTAHFETSTLAARPVIAHDARNGFIVIGYAETSCCWHGRGGHLRHHVHQPRCEAVHRRCGGIVGARVHGPLLWRAAP